MEKKLYYGDNLAILRDYIPDESVDLIYLDPPFNSQATYNVLFAEPTGKESAAQIKAFDDTWHWTEETERTFRHLAETAPAQVVNMLNAFSDFIRKNDMLAYLTMMTARLLELRRVLKPTGSIYLHCDPTASHYLKIVMDTIFNFENFRNEITWLRTTPKSHTTRRFSSAHDTIFFYSKSEKATFNMVYMPYSKEYLDKFYRHVEPETGRRYTLGDLVNPNPDRPHLTYEFKGVTRVWRWTKERMLKADREGRIVWTEGKVPRYKRYLDEMPGVPATTVWTDIKPIQSHAKERLGYPTQKPRALLERIVRASAPKDGTVLDPFCGCGTTISACEYLNDNEDYNLSWVGMDITHLAINLIKFRLASEFGLEQKKDYEVIGEPVDASGARELAEQDRFQFECWALSLITATPYDDKKKGADTGIDGYVFFIDPEKPKKIQRGIVQVKSGKVGVKDIRELKAVVERDKAPIGLFITLEPPTKPMETEAVQAGFIMENVPKIQILKIEELLSGKKPRIPLQINPIKQAEKSKRKNKNLSFDF